MGFYLRILVLFFLEEDLVVGQYCSNFHGRNKLLVIKINITRMGCGNKITNVTIGCHYVFAPTSGAGRVGPTTELRLLSTAGISIPSYIPTCPARRRNTY